MSDLRNPPNLGTVLELLIQFAWKIPACIEMVGDQSDPHISSTLPVSGTETMSHHKSGGSNTLRMGLESRIVSLC